MEERTADRASIQAIVDSLTAAWNQADDQQWAAAYSDDAVFINIIGMVMQGREPIRAQHAAIWSSMYRGSRLAQTVRYVKFVGSNAAFVDVDILLSGIRELPPGAVSDSPGGKPAITLCAL